MTGIETLILSNTLVSAFFGIAYFIYSLEQKTYPGFRLWAFSPLIMTFGFLAIIYRGTISVGVSVFAVNGLFILVAIIRLDAIKRFLVKKSLNKLLYLTPFFVALASSTFYFTLDRIDIRTFIVSLALFIVSLSISWNLVRYSPPENRLLYNSAGVFIAIRGLIILTRAFLFQAGNQHIIFDNNIWSSIQLEFGLISEVGQNVIFLMMNSKRAKVNSIQSESKLNATVIDLQKALSEVKTLQGILPICSHCKKIRDDHGSWHSIEQYIHEHSDAQFSHGVCQDCAKKYYPDIDLSSTRE
ncbi:hypothetical protein [Oceanispirochaeta sp.]|jgi:hypothetical protein|uniref:hypothetical protein n=1 Tax=Oceanispirochaeta sp. TaxID=2035350 RepID=UPI002634BF89|nr:hypothetical protein [Oceanispirochaeta sp.]MDA3956678.1 hypothetical protein [Oceanispirochaeta sp.]